MSAARVDDPASLRADATNAAFPTPWAARAFALAMAAAEAKLFDRAEFQAGLIESIRRYESEGRCIEAEQAYYGCWIEALIELLGRKQVVERHRVTAAEHRIGQRLEAAARGHSHDDDAPHDMRAPAPIFVEPGR